MTYLTLNIISLFCSPGGKSWTLFYHFVGAIPGSCCLESMLKRLLKEAEFVNVSNII